MFSLLSWGKKRRPLARVRSEFERLFDHFCSRWPASFETDSGVDRIWAVEMEDRDAGIVVRAEICRLRDEQTDNPAHP